MFARSAALAAILCITGCASVRDFAHEHPVATAIGGAMIVGSVAASLSSHHDGETPPDIATPRDPCMTPESCR